VHWTDRSSSVLSMVEKRAHATEIQETAARHQAMRDRLRDRLASVPMIDAVTPRRSARR
jgi:hypothetical protein